MKVRDHTKNLSEYKGHWTYAVDANCPCRSCYNSHDCTPPNRAYSNQLYSEVFHCASNWNNGCPSPLPKPVHIPRLRGVICERCKQSIKLKVVQCQD